MSVGVIASQKSIDTNCFEDNQTILANYPPHGISLLFTIWVPHICKYTCSCLGAQSFQRLSLPRGKRLQKGPLALLEGQILEGC